jgi:hypothetical protein
MSQPPEVRAGRWFRQSLPLTVTHVFLPFTDNSEHPAVYLNEGPTDRFVFLIPFKDPDNRITSMEDAVREFPLILLLFFVSHNESRLPR